MNATWKVCVALVAAVSVTAVAAEAAKKSPQSGPGRVQIGVEASEWSSDTDAGPGILPVGGSGQVNGEFVIVQKNGIEIGLRAQERFQGTIEATNDKKVGVYEALSGESQAATNRGTWNIDWHVDLRSAKGVAKGTTLDDYDLTLEFNEVGDEPTTFELTPEGEFPSGVVLYQSSQNPGFGWMSAETGYDAFEATTYEVNLILTPVSFNGPAIQASMRVVVSAP